MIKIEIIKMKKCIVCIYNIIPSVHLSMQTIQFTYSRE